MEGSEPAAAVLASCHWAKPLLLRRMSSSPLESLSLSASSAHSSSFGSDTPLSASAPGRQELWHNSAPNLLQPMGAQLQVLEESRGDSLPLALSLQQQQQQPAGSLWQAKVLKVINTFHTKEELLGYVATCHQQLDDINIVTVIYRLARMYSSIRNASARWHWSTELQANSTFQHLLGHVQSHVLSARMQLMCNGTCKSLDARGVSNLIWAVIKLDLAANTACLGHEIVQMAAPVVLHVLPSSSSQGLANLLWAYSKLPVLMLKIMMAIAAEMAIRLENEVSRFDAQALSNSIWALAHVRVSVADMDAAAGFNGHGLTKRFMLGIASCALVTLRTLRTKADPMHLQASMQEAEHKFSAQALVNICWSFASLLGEDCCKVPAVRTLFLTIRAEALIRLRATATALQLGQAWATSPQGGFNEQALSNIIYAFERTQMLDKELLQLVYDVAALRLDKTQGMPPAFKPQELCTLLRAAHSNVASPWVFLSKVHAMVVHFPHLVQPWSTAERTELDRALSLLDVYRTTCLLQQLQNERQRALQDHLSALALLPLAWP